ncbi:HEAT repeat domain-containing protein [uncultured Methanobacterium sp.]|uniref:HEAT repeat domain-containing protein n=1 Tax=uncultured Methanobacterium sp. TaxID=176306 RepID=UPI002AA80912|nr:HEAT repeat domain-containing protein [uncultured Methanobacterium sp.]
MKYYDLTKDERQRLVIKMENELMQDLKSNKNSHILQYSSNEDVYIRKNVSNILGKIYREQNLVKEKIIQVAVQLLENDDEKVRQTAVYILGEIGKQDADPVFDYIEIALEDPHHRVKNAVMSSLKVMGQKNPQPTLNFAKVFIHHPQPEVRKKVIHGIELRGRTHPEDVLPLLEELQDETNPAVRKMIIHVLGQISYKKGCLEKVTSALKTWKNKKLVENTILYILEVHENYPFSAMSPEEAKEYLKTNFSEYNIQL